MHVVRVCACIARVHWQQPTNQPESNIPSLENQRKMYLLFLAKKKKKKEKNRLFALFGLVPLPNANKSLTRLAVLGLKLYLHGPM